MKRRKTTRRTIGRTNKITLTDEECHDLYDMLYMIESGLIKINKLQKSYDSIFEKLEEFCIPELCSEVEEWN